MMSCGRVRTSKKGNAVQFFRLRHGDGEHHQRYYFTLSFVPDVILWSKAWAQLQTHDVDYWSGQEDQRTVGTSNYIYDTLNAPEYHTYTDKYRGAPVCYH